LSVKLWKQTKLQKYFWASYNNFRDAGSF